jgi:CHASE2 domain-containing sensor protein
MKIKPQTLLLFLETIRLMIFSGLVVLLLLLLTRLINFGAFDLYRLAFKEFSFLDTFYAQRMYSKSQLTVNNNINLVNVGHLKRYEIAELIEKIHKQKPKVIGVDVIFDHSKKDRVDKKLWSALQHENVIGVFAFQNETISKNHAVLDVFRDKLGYANFNFDYYNSVIRSFLAIKTFNDNEYQSFGLKVAQKFVGDEKKLSWRKMDKKSIPINYSGGLEHYNIVEPDTIFAKTELRELKDKIVLLGYMGTPTGNLYDIEDKHFTPLNQEFLGKSSPDTFGIVIHANIIEMLINDKRHWVVPMGLVWSFGLVITFFVLSYFIKLNKKHLSSYIFTRKLLQLGFTIIFIGLSLWLLSKNIYFKITALIWYIVLSLQCVWAYKLLINYLHKKYKWKSYFFQS